LLVSTIALSGCVACPDSKSCATDNLAWPLHLPLSIPCRNDECESCECGSACDPAADDAQNCSDVPLNADESGGAEDSVYQRVIDGAIVQPAATVAMSSFSIAGTAFSMAGSAFGSVANYFLPEVALGPPEIAPPGRFHPVPTRPVFARSE
jgi:hypothetical protein